MTDGSAGDAAATHSAEQASPLDDPVLNGPYDPPTRFFEIGPKGPTGVVLEGRRPSESFIPVPKPKKRPKKGSKPDGEQLSLTLHPEEDAQKNQLINDLRAEVSHWRTTGYEGVTTITRKLLNHWADEHRDNRILFAQREAAETAIFLAEVAGRRSGYKQWRTAIASANDAYNDGLPRTALKMATGSGKTVVMAMLIAWQTLNKVANPRDRRFVKRFLVVTPGITIRDRLRVLQPNDPNNYYAARDIVPAGLEGSLGKAQIIITNWHAFQLRDSKEIKGVAKATRQILLAERSDDPFKETEDAMVSRVLRGWGVATGGYDAARGKARIGEIMVFNDEAHHCYQDKPITLEDEYEGVDAPDKEAAERNADARIWFTGLQAIARRVGVKQVFDLSATPFYLSGSGYKEGFIFPWTVSDFSLMDAIESGIVKVPRIPVDDDALADGVTYLDLWERIGEKLPKRNRKGLDVTSWSPPEELDGALDSLYESYRRSFTHWQNELEALGEPPPVFIVVCPNTAVSKLIYDRIAGADIPDTDGNLTHSPGRLTLFRNADEYGQPLSRPRTILVDSAQLESGGA